MASRADTRFAAILAAGWTAWLDSAYVLTGSEAVAEDLVLAALLRARRSWRQLEAGGDPAAEVHAEVFRLHAARMRPRFCGPRGELPGSPPDTPERLQRHRQDLVWASLRDLPAAQRAAVVLRVVETADLSGSAAVLGRSQRSVAALLRNGMDALTAGAAPGWGSPPSGNEVVATLSVEARRRLADLTGSGAPVEVVLRAVRLDRGRRVRAALAGTAGCLAAVAVVALVQRPDPAPGGPAGPASRTGTVQIAGDTWPLAGSLSADPTVVAELEAALARSGRVGWLPPRVVFAGDLDDRRIVLATDGAGHAWFLHGRGGGSIKLLDGYGAPTAVDGPGGPLAVLVPRPGTDADLLVVAPESVRVQVSDRPAVWPMVRPRYQVVDAPGGVRWYRLAARAPFALSSVTVSVRGLAGTGPLAGVLFALEDPDPVVHDHRDTRGLAARYSGQLEGTVVDAAATAVGAASFGEEPLELSVAATSTAAGCRQGPCRTTAAVVDAVVDGIRSRTLAVHSGTAAESPLLMAGSDTAPPSSADLPDHRPRVVGFRPDIEGLPVGTMVWADSPRGRITFTVGAHRAPRSARLDARGFVWLGQWDVQVRSVEGADGLGRWSDHGP